jgi:hypothetical protein
VGALCCEFALQFLQFSTEGMLGWSLSAILNREVPLRRVESLLSAYQCVPSERVKVGDSYHLQGSVEKREAVLSTELPAAVDHG